MTCSTTTPYTVVRGDTWELPGPTDVFTLQVDGEPVTGLDDPAVVISSHVRRSTSAAAPLIVELTVVEVDLAAAQVRLVAEADATGVAPNGYVFDIEVVDAVGRVTTFGRGAGEPFRLLVKGDSTHG